MKSILLYLPEPYLQALKDLVEAKMYPSVSEAIRMAIRDLLSQEAWNIIDPDTLQALDEANIKWVKAWR